jgi:hypothetical protein
MANNLYILESKERYYELRDSYKYTIFYREHLRKMIILSLKKT